MKSSHRKGRWPVWVLSFPVALILLALAPWVASWLPSCPLREKTGLLCPGCGGTRAALAVREGNWVGAIRHNVLLVSAMTFGIAWASLCAARVRFPNVLWLQRFQVRLPMLWYFLAGVLLFWVLRNLPGMEKLRPLPTSTGTIEGNDKLTVGNGKQGV